MRLQSPSSQEIDAGRMRRRRADLARFITAPSAANGSGRPAPSRALAEQERRGNQETSATENSTDNAGGETSVRAAPTIAQRPEPNAVAVRVSTAWSTCSGESSQQQRQAGTDRANRPMGTSCRTSLPSTFRNRIIGQQQQYERAAIFSCETALAAEIAAKR